MVRLWLALAAIVPAALLLGWVEPHSLSALSMHLAVQGSLFPCAEARLSSLDVS